MKPFPKESDSNFVTHTSCDACGSSDANGVFDDGHTFCFSCNTYTEGEESGGPSDDAGSSEIPNQSEAQQKSLLKGVPKAIPARGLTEATCRKYGYLIGHHNGEPVQIATYRDKTGAPVAQKIRTADKKFSVVGKAPGTMFGQHLWSKGKMLVVCEGELDCLSYSQANQNSWPCVSLPSGAAGAVRAFKDNWDYVNQFDSIILMFDQDQAGQKAAQEVAALLPPGKAKIAHLPYKDANEVLLKGQPKDLVNAAFQAQEYRPEGIKAANDYRDVISVDDTASSVSWPYSLLNDILLGIRKKELITLASGSGCGKTTFCKELIHHLLMSGQKVGVISLEEAPKRTLLGLVGIHLNKNLLIDRGQASDDEVLAGFDDLFTDRTCVLYDAFGSNPVDMICQRIEFMCKTADIDFLILDHVTMLTSEMADERRELDRAATAFREIVQTNDIGMLMVSHLTRPGGRGHEDGASVSLSQLRGSHALAQLADAAIGLQKDPDDPDSDVRQLRVLKNRFSGQIGDAGNLVYDRETGRLLEEAVASFATPENDNQPQEEGDDQNAERAN